jgi:imidazolonepropionase-like amidohydrolase
MTRRILVLLFAAVMVPFRGHARQPSGITAITNVSAIPMDRDLVIADATILISGDRITRIGPSNSITVPRGARRIDGRGLFAVPGFADMHTHPYDTEGFASYLAYGITTIAVMHGFPAVLDWRDKQRRGVLDGPTIYSASPTVNGFPPGNPQFISVQDTIEARAVARDQKTNGYDFIKAYSMLNADVYDALLDEAKRVHIPVVGHIPWQMDYAHVIDKGQSNVAHIEEFFQNGDIPDDSMPAIARRVKASGATVTANLFAYADYLHTIDDIQAVLHDPEMRYASPAQYSEKLPTSNRATNRRDLPGFAKFLRERRVRFQKLLRAFRDAGVPILVGTDTETFGFPGQSAYLEMLQLREAGLTPYEVLEAATRSAGEFVTRVVDRAEHFGMLAPGMRADIVLLRANPLADITSASKVAGTMSRGRWYPADRLKQMRDSVAERTTPQRQFVERFDSLITQAKDASAALAALREFRAQYPTAVPIAELVWIGYGRLLYAQDKISSTEIRRIASEVYPRSSSAQNQIGRAFLFRFDTTEALKYFRKAQNLSPHDLVVRDMIAKLEAARAGPTSSTLGRFVFDTIRVKIEGQMRALRLMVDVRRDTSVTSARVFVNGDSAIVASEAVAGPSDVWITAPYAGNDLELRWASGRAGQQGTWVLGWGKNGTLRGVMRP